MLYSKNKSFERRLISIRSDWPNCELFSWLFTIFSPFLFAERILIVWEDFHCCQKSFTDGSSHSMMNHRQSVDSIWARGCKKLGFFKHNSKTTRLIHQSFSINQNIMFTLIKILAIIVFDSRRSRQKIYHKSFEVWINSMEIFLGKGVWRKWKKNPKLLLTSSYINCKVRADFPTPPAPTIITLCTGTGNWDWGCCEIVCNGLIVADLVEFSSLYNILSNWYQK